MDSSELYESIIDEELKTYLRKKKFSKFGSIELNLEELERKKYFDESISSSDRTRKSVVESYFKATFKAWRDYYKEYSPSGSFVGYSPGIVLDTERILADFPKAKIVHIVRNPFSAFADTKKRPFPLRINEYILSWNIYHSVAISYKNLYPNSLIMVSYDDFVKNKKKTMRAVSEFLKIKFDECMLYPSFNSREISGIIAPW
jgi:hypothetical protein